MEIMSDGDSSKKFVELFMVRDGGQVEVTGDDPGLVVVTGSVTSQLQDVSS